VSDLVTTREAGVARLVLNRPEQRNALTYEMLELLRVALAEAAGDPEVRAVLLTGEGAGFCSGLDLSLMPIGDPESSAAPLELKRILTERIQPVMLALGELEKPVIAAVNGAAVGAGMDLALACDIRIAGRSARFSEGYIKIGLVPGAGGAHLLPRIVGRARALELLLTGDFVDAAEAERTGLVNRVVDDEELAAEAFGLAAKIAAVAPAAAALIKRAVNAGEASDFRASLDLVSSHLAVLSTTHDTREALAALREKRPPAFRGD
jgi:enoyl-CoA hydratase/carnithine racemase